MNTFRFRPLTLLSSTCRLHAFTQRRREPCLVICCTVDRPACPVGEEGDWETDQWPAGLDYCPGAMVTGTNQYYISMIALYRYSVATSLAFHLSGTHTHPHTHMGFQ